MGEAVDLVDNHHVDAMRGPVGEQPLQGRAVGGAAGKTAVVVAVRKPLPAFRALAEDIGGAGFRLRIKRAEVLLEARPRSTCGCRSRSGRRPSAAPWSSAGPTPAQAEESRSVASAAGDLAGDGGERFLGPTAPDEAALDDMHLVALAAPVPNEPGARQKLPGRGRPVRIKGLAGPCGCLQAGKTPGQVAGGAAEQRCLPAPGDAERQKTPPRAFRRRRTPGGGPGLLQVAGRELWQLRDPLRQRRSCRQLLRQSGVRGHGSGGAVQAVNPPPVDPFGADVEAALAQAGQRRPAGVPQPVRRAGDLLDRRAFGLGDHLKHHAELAARSRDRSRDKVKGVSGTRRSGEGSSAAPTSASPAAARPAGVITRLVADASSRGRATASSL